MERINLAVVVAALVVLVMSAAKPNLQEGLIDHPATQDEPVGKYQISIECKSNGLNARERMYWVATDTTTGEFYWRVGDSGEWNHASSPWK